MIGIKMKCFYISFRPGIGVGKSCDGNNLYEIFCVGHDKRHGRA